MAEEQGKNINIGLLIYKMDEMAKHIDTIEKKLDEKTVGRTEFELRVGRVEKLVYGALGIGVLAIGKELVELVIK